MNDLIISVEVSMQVELAYLHPVICFFGVEYAMRPFSRTDRYVSVG